MKLNGPLSVHKVDAEAMPATSEALEEVLKEHYYRVDPAEYFERRLWGIIALADMKPNAVDWNSSDDGCLFGQFKRVLKDKKFALDVPPGNTLSSRTMAAVESYTLMQHVIETALRLFVASNERVVGNSPMTKLLNMRQAVDLREPLKPLLGGAARHAVEKAMFPPELQHDESSESKAEMRRHLDFLTAWLSFFARFYSEEDYNGAQGNNQLKHGAAVAPREDLSSVLHLTEEPPASLTEGQWNEAYALINAESISYVVQERRKDMLPGLNLRTDNSDPATNLGISQIGIGIVRSLWQMSRVVAFPNTQDDYAYDYSPMPHEFFTSANKPPRSVAWPLLEPTPRPARPTNPPQHRKKNRSGKG